jgi:uncharacterized membrane protein
MRETGHERQPIGKQRMEALSDGIYAIALTLLVLDLKVPSLPSGASEQALQQALLALLPKVSTWLSSFWIMSLSWLAQQRLYALCVALDRAMIWTELAQLAVISLIPFTTALAGAYRTHPTVAVIYGAQFLVAMLLSYVRTNHLLKTPALHSPDLTPRISSRLRLRMRVLIGCAAVTTALAFVFPRWSTLGMLPAVLPSDLWSNRRAA